MTTQPTRATNRDQIALIAILVTVFVASFVLPVSPLYEVRVCLFHNLTGYSCPGCGLGRSFCALSRGDVGLAFSAHWLGPAFYLVFLFVLVRALAELALRRRLPRLWTGRVGRVVGTGALVLILFAWIVRLVGEMKT